jgi:hypothetical protein
VRLALTPSSRIGGLVKRLITITAKKRGKNWHEVVGDAQRTWNSTYVSRFGIGPPDDIYEANFDKVIEGIYEKSPLYMDSLYPVSEKALDSEEAASIFRYKKGDRVLVSLRSVSKRIRNPVRVARATLLRRLAQPPLFSQISSKYYSEIRHPSWARAKVRSARLAFSQEKRGLVKSYAVKLKSGPVATVHEDEMKRDKSVY